MLDKYQFEVPDSGEIPRTLSFKLAIAITHELDKSLQQYYRGATALGKQRIRFLLFPDRENMQFCCNTGKSMYLLFILVIFKKFQEKLLNKVCEGIFTG